jgi:hypothetical protein
MQAEAPDTSRSSAITDHRFSPRIDPAAYGRSVLGKTTQRWDRSFPPNPYLCQHCRLAEAAHSETTVKRSGLVCKVCGGPWNDSTTSCMLCGGQQAKVLW